MYRIVVSTNMCYYSENQISNSNMPQFFLGKKLFCLLLDFLDIPATWQTHYEIGKLLWTPCYYLSSNSISSMGCYYSRRASACDYTVPQYQILSCYRSHIFGNFNEAVFLLMLCLSDTEKKSGLLLLYVHLL